MKNRIVELGIVWFVIGWSVFVALLVTGLVTIERTNVTKFAIMIPTIAWLYFIPLVLFFRNKKRKNDNGFNTIDLSKKLDKSLSVNPETGDVKEL